MGGVHVRETVATALTRPFTRDASHDLSRAMQTRPTLRRTALMRDASLLRFSTTRCTGAWYPVARGDAAPRALCQSVQQLTPPARPLSITADFLSTPLAATARMASRHGQRVRRASNTTSRRRCSGMGAGWPPSRWRHHRTSSNPPAVGLARMRTLSRCGMGARDIPRSRVAFQ